MQRLLLRVLELNKSDDPQDRKAADRMTIQIMKLNEQGEEIEQLLKDASHRNNNIQIVLGMISRAQIEDHLEPPPVYTNGNGGKH